MMYTTKEKKRTGPGVSDPQGPAGVGGIVPAPSPSSSDVGLPPASQESAGEDMAISCLAKGLFRSLSASKRNSGSDSGPTISPEKDLGGGGGSSPGPSTSAPGGSGAVAGDAVFKRPGPLSSKKRQEARIILSSDDDDSDGMSVSGGDMTPFSDMSSDTNRVVTGATKKKGRGRPATTGEWVGVEGVRRELELLKKEHEKVLAERDVLAGRPEVSFGTTAGGIPSAAALMEEFTDETVDSLINVIIEEMEAVERVAERSGALKGTFKGRLRAASRRALAASKLLFHRATTCAAGGGAEEAGLLDRTRCELKAARDLIEKSQDRIRRLEEEVKVLKAKETLLVSRAGRTSPPPHETPSFTGVDCGGDRMEVEDSPEVPIPRRSPPPPIGTPAGGGPPEGPAPSFDLVERIVSRVLGKLRPLAAPPVQPPPPAPRAEPWSRVVGRKAGRKAADRRPAGEAASSSLPSPPAEGGGARKGKKKGPKKDPVGARPAPKPGPAPQKKAKSPAGVVREPRTAAVLVTVSPGASATLAEVLRKTRPLADEIPGFNRAGSRLKRAQAGGLLIQVPGGEGHRLADELAAKMRQAVAGEEGVRVARPVKTAELRLHGLDDSITHGEVLESVAELANCRAEDLSLGEIKRLPNRMGSAWLRCPVAVSNKLLETGKWRIGWATIVAKPLPARRMRCFRCLEAGHGAAACKGPDRSGRCYRCSDRSHSAKECTAGVLKCPLCVSFGIPAGHALGAAACVPGRRAAQKRLAIMAKKKGALVPPTEGVGEGSKGGPCGAEPPETSAPAGPAGGERGIRPRAAKGSSSSAPKKGSTDGGGVRAGKSSLKRTASARSPSVQRGSELAESEQAGQMSPPSSAPEKKRDLRGRFSTR